MDDLVEQLRELDAQFTFPGTCGEAADEIERLRHEIAVMTHGIELENEKLREQLAACQKERDDHLRSWNRVVDENVKLREQLATVTKERDDARSELADMMKALEVRKLYWDGTKYVEAQ